MRYLKTFESKTEEEDIKKFCEDNLAYLIDSGFRIIIDNTKKKDYYSSDIFDYNYSNYYDIYLIKDKLNDSFQWSDIKYDFIPFFEELNRKYEILPVSNRTGYVNAKDTGYVKFKTKRYTGQDLFCFSKDDILNDKIINSYTKKLHGINSTSRRRYMKDSIDPVLIHININIRKK